MKRLWLFLTRGAIEDFWKDARKVALWALLIAAAGYVAAFIREAFKLDRALTFWDVPNLLLAALRRFFDKLTDPFEYAANHPLAAALIISLATLAGLLVYFVRRANRRIKQQRAQLDDLSAYHELAILAGLKGWWPHAARDGSGAPWKDLRADIERAENNSLCILGANGFDTFGADSAPLHETLRRFPRPIRVILLAPESQSMERRAMAVGTRPTQYRKNIETSAAFLKSLKSQSMPVEGRFYDGRANWKLIITNRTCWMQYYSPGGPDVERTPVYRFDATSDGYGLYHYFCMEFERIWERCEYSGMDLD